MLDDYIPRKIQGIIMLIIGLLFLLWAGSLGWNGYQRWVGINALHDARLADYLGREDFARARANQAAQLNTVAATAISNIDPLAETSIPNLERLSRSVEKHKRDVGTALAFAQVLQGKSHTADKSTLNGQYLAAMQDIEKAQSVPVPKLPSKKGSGPDRNIQMAALERRFRKAWALGDLAAIRNTAGAMTTLDPMHPSAPYLNLMLMVPHNREHGNVLKSLASKKTVPNDKIKAAALRAGALIFPDHCNKALALVPGTMRSPQEMIAGQGKIEDKVKRAIATKNVEVLKMMAAYAIEQNRFDQLRVLGKHGDQDFRKTVATLLATRDWDVKALKELGVNIDTVKPTVQLLHTGFDFLSFHVVDSQGIPPRVGFEVKINGRVIPVEQVVRIASMVWIPAPGTGRMELKVRMKGLVIHNAEVIR